MIATKFRTIILPFMEFNGIIFPVSVTASGRMLHNATIWEKYTTALVLNTHAGLDINKSIDENKP